MKPLAAFPLFCPDAACCAGKTMNKKIKNEKKRISWFKPDALAFHLSIAWRLISPLDYLFKSLSRLITKKSWIPFINQCEKCVHVITFKLFFQVPYALWLDQSTTNPAMWWIELPWPPVRIKIDIPQTSNMRRTKYKNCIVSLLVLQLSLPNPLKPGVKLRMKM